MVEAHYGATNIAALIGFSYEPVNTDCMETHGERIRRLRKERQLTQEDLAALSGVDQSSLSGIEKRNVMPSGDTLIRLCEALNVQAEYVMRGRSATWPFRVEMGRFLALAPEDRAFVEGKLEAAIESREYSSVTSTTALSGLPLQGTESGRTTPDPAIKTNTLLDNARVGGKRAAGSQKSGGVQKPRSGRGPKRAA